MSEIKEVDLRRRCMGPEANAAACGELGRFLAGQGRLKEAIVLLESAIDDPQEFFRSWVVLLLAWIDDGSVSKALTFLQSRPPQLSWMLRFHFLKEAARTRRFDIIESIHRTSDPNTVEAMIDSFWLAYAEFHRRRHDQAVDLFHEAAAMGQAAWNKGIRLRFIPDFIAVGAPLLSSRELARLDLSPDEVSPQPCLQWIETKDQSEVRNGPVVVIGCDERYFLRFSDECLTAMRRNGFSRCHIHLAGCGSEARALMPKLRSRFPELAINFTVEPQPAVNRLVYYSSCRFLYAPQLMEYYQTDLVITDIDSSLTTNANLLPDFLGDHDIGAYFVADTMPWLTFLAGLVWCRPTPATKKFLRLVANALSAMLPFRTEWMLDQAVLYCVNQHLVSQGDLRSQDFAAVTNQNIEWVLAPLTTSEEKSELRNLVLKEYAKC